MSTERPTNPILRGAACANIIAFGGMIMSGAARHGGDADTLTLVNIVIGTLAGFAAFMVWKRWLR